MEKSQEELEEAAELEELIKKDFRNDPELYNNNGTRKEEEKKPDIFSE